jgi:hypothetical protein
MQWPLWRRSMRLLVLGVSASLPFNHATFGILLFNGYGEGTVRFGKGFETGTVDVMGKIYLDQAARRKQRKKLP